MSSMEAWQASCQSEDSARLVRRAPREVTLKVVVLGDLMVGKTSLVQRYVNNAFNPCYKETIGVDFTMKLIQWEPDLNIKLQFWDISGTERMGTMTRAYYRNAHGCLVLFDLTDQASFYRVPGWKEDLDAKCRLPDGSFLPCLLLANKSDLVNKWTVTPNDVATICRTHSFSEWRVVSVKDNIGVDEALSYLLQQMVAQSGKRRNGTLATSQESASIVLSTPTTSSRSRSSRSRCC
ncbi:ras-related protein Rab-7L1-like [Babylonia areolata]|uniref:ras-related protein Rab-7L1-like n=1 Tax=Babylonia areolata TaxID=304850 RepID=UPI003FD53FC6